MSKKELTVEELEKVTGGQSDDLYTRQCTFDDCGGVFDIRTVNYQYLPEEHESGEGYIGSSQTIVFECPHCHRYTPTKSVETSGITIMGA